MFKACFVARVDPAEKSINIFCQFRNEDLGTTTDLPNSDNLGKFCFPLGPEQVKAKEYCAPEVLCPNVATPASFDAGVKIALAADSALQKSALNLSSAFTLCRSTPSL